MAYHDNYFLEFANITTPDSRTIFKHVFAHSNGVKFMSRLFSRIISADQDYLISTEIIPELNLSLSDSNHQYEYGLDELELITENSNVKIQLKLY